MKFLSTLILFCIAAHFLKAGDPGVISTEIKQVTVFRSGAQVIRTGSADIQSGRQTLVFGNITPRLDESSIQVQGEGNFTILSVSGVRNFQMETPSTPELKVLEDKIKLITERIEDEQVNLSVYKDEDQLLIANKNLTASTNGTSADAVQRMAELYRIRLADIRKKILESNRRLTQMEKERILAKNEYEEKKKKGTTGMEFAILVDVDVPIGMRAPFTLKYIVPEATWNTAYDLRVKDIKQPIALTTRAEVTQSSGEDWNKVQITFSTGDPNRNTTPPVLSPWWLNFMDYTNYEMQKQNVPYGAAMQARADAANVRSARDADSPLIVSQENITAMEYQVTQWLTIPSDGKQHTVQIQSADIPASYHYRVIPSRDLRAYLIGSIQDWQKYNLSSAQANIYFEGTFVGKTYIQPLETSDTLDISLGQDIAISVSRERMKEYCKTKFLSNKKQQTFGWRIEVRNNKKAAIDLEILDQVPLTANSEIEVEVEKLSGAKQNTETGEIQWMTKLSPGEKFSKELIYTVRSPKDKRINL